MKTNAYKNELRDNSLAKKLMDTIANMTEDFDFILPRGWRFIAKIVTESDNGTPPHQLFYLDIQADEGGGSWAEAKIQTMETMDLAATQPLEYQKIFRVIHQAGLGSTSIGKEICDLKDVADISKEQMKWLVDVKNGPGIAPNFGGLRLKADCHFFKENLDASLSSSKWNPVTETDTIYVAFSGAAAWQDLQFATCALKRIINHLDDIPDEAFEFDSKPLEEIPEVRLWLKNYGLTR